MRTELEIRREYKKVSEQRPELEDIDQDAGEVEAGFWILSGARIALLWVLGNERSASYLDALRRYAIERDGDNPTDFDALEREFNGMRE